MTRAIVFAYVLLVAACGGASSSSAVSSSGSPESGNIAAQPAPAEPPAPASAPERLTGIFERLASELTAVRGDCIQLAGVVTSWVESHRADYPKLAQSASSTTLSDQDKQRYGDRLRTAIQTIEHVSTGCQGSEQVRNAFAELDRLLNGP